MGHDDLRELFERLEALERLARERFDDRGDRHGRGDRGDRGDRGSHGDRDRHGDRHHHRGRDHHERDRHHDGHHDRHDRGGDFDEKHLVDTIVKLVGERVERSVQDKLARLQRRDDGGDERRRVDLVVRLVGERVEEIVQRVVAAELDRRLGRSAEERGPGGSDPDVH